MSLFVEVVMTTTKVYRTTSLVSPLRSQSKREIANDCDSPSSFAALRSSPCGKPSSQAEDPCRTRRSKIRSRRFELD